MAVKALGDAHLKCCIQMCCSLLLTTKGSVRTLVRSVEADSLKKGKGRAKANTTTRKEISRPARPARPTRAPQTSTSQKCGRTGGAHDNSTSNNSNTQKGKSPKGKANAWTLWKPISLLKQLQPCRILQLENSRAIQTWNCVDHRCDNQFRVSTRRQVVQSICFLTVVHRFTPVRSRIQDRTSGSYRN